MTEWSEECLSAFPKWLDTLNEDAVALAALLADDTIPEQARRCVAGALNYLLKSLDIIPDGIEDLGYIDDAFILRLASSNALESATAQDTNTSDVLVRLAKGTLLVEKLLGKDYPRLVKYARSIETAVASGRTVDVIIGDPCVRMEMVRDVQGWANRYESPRFPHDEQMLIKLRSFLSARLP